MPTTAPETKDLIKALRARLKLTQDQVAERAGDGFRRTEVVKIEKGDNQATTDRIRAGLARAFGVTRDDLADYLEGKVEIDTLLRRRDAASRPAQQVIDRDERYPNRLEAARFARANGLPEEPIGLVCAEELEFDEDPSPEFWWTRMKSKADELKMARKDPSAAERERQLDIKKVREAKEATRLRDPRTVKR